MYDLRAALPDRTRRRRAAVALSILNDVITREAFTRRLSLIDLRVIFNEDADFANPIEPSIQGGMKLARSIHRFVAEESQVITEVCCFSELNLPWDSVPCWDRAPVCCVQRWTEPASPIRCYGRV